MVTFFLSIKFLKILWKVLSFFTKDMSVNHLKREMNTDILRRRDFLKRKQQSIIIYVLIVHKYKSAWLEYKLNREAKKIFLKLRIWGILNIMDSIELDPIW